jgi:UPF0716 family protein affecting phage T7 exclusion
VRRNPLLVDGILAITVAAIVLIVAPGLAITAILALLVLIACAVTVLIDRRGRPAPRRRRRPGSR